MTSTGRTHHQFHLNLLKAGFNRLIGQPPFNSPTISSDDQDYLDCFAALIDALETHEPEVLQQGQILFCTLVRAYPHLVPLIDRDLFWYFGGDCLHFMPDEEIADFQRLDELRHEAETQNKNFNIEEERARIFKLH